MNKKDGQTALHYISSNCEGEGYAEMIHYLIINGGEINLKDKVLIFIWIWMNIGFKLINKLEWSNSSS